MEKTCHPRLGGACRRQAGVFGINCPFVLLYAMITYRPYPYSAKEHH